MKFSKELIKIFEKKLNEEFIFNYYDNLVDEWHTSIEDNGSLSEYLGLDNEMYNLFVFDRDKFLKALKNKYVEFKVENDINYSFTHEHYVDFEIKKENYSYGSFKKAVETLWK